jgi:hypothetical protein
MKQSPLLSSSFAYVQHVAQHSSSSLFFLCSEATSRPEESVVTTVNPHITQQEGHPLCSVQPKSKGKKASL